MARRRRAVGRWIAVVALLVLVAVVLVGRRLWLYAANPVGEKDCGPPVDEFFAAKREYDPDRRFTSHFYEKYGPGG